MENEEKKVVIDCKNSQRFYRGGCEPLSQSKAQNEARSEKKRCLPSKIRDQPKETGNWVEEIWIIFPPIRLRDNATSQMQTRNQSSHGTPDTSISSRFAFTDREMDEKPNEIFEYLILKRWQACEDGGGRRWTGMQSRQFKSTWTCQTFTNSPCSWRLEWNYASSFATGRGWSVCSAGVFSWVLACVVGKVCQSRLLQAFHLGLHTTLFALLRTSIHRYSVLYEPYAPCSMSSEQFRLSSETVFSWVLCHYTPCPRCSLLWDLPAS